MRLPGRNGWTALAAAALALVVLRILWTPPGEDGGAREPAGAPPTVAADPGRLAGQDAGHADSAAGAPGDRAERSLVTAPPAAEGLAVRVRMPDGTPAADVTVQALRVAFPYAELLATDLDGGVAPTVRSQRVAEATSDADGRCVLGATPPTLVLHARGPGRLVGTAVVGSRSDREQELRLRDPGTRRVRVLDAEGRPLAGVPVEVDVQSELHRFTGTSLVTGADGTAPLPFFDGSKQLAWKLGASVHVQLGVLGPVQARGFAPGEAVPEVIEFQLPGVGQVDVVGLAPGRDGRVELAARGASYDGLHRVPSRIVDGAARFVAVAPGSYALRAEIQYDNSFGELELTGAAPEFPGDRVTLDAGALPVFELVGRVLTPDGTPVSGGVDRANLRVALAFSPAGALRESGLAPALDGRFRVLLPLRSFELELEGLLVSLGELAVRRELQVPVVAGRHDLGDLVLAPTPVLVAGRVRLADGEPLSAAYLVARGPQPEDPQRAALGPLVLGEAYSDGLGRFRMLDDFRPLRAAGGTLFLEFEQEYYAAPVAFVAGDEDVEITVRRAGEVHAAWDPGEGWLSGSIDVELVDRGSTVLAAAGLVEFEEVEGGARSAVWAGLPAGLYDLLFRLEGVEEELLRIDALRVVDGGSCEDPRIQAIRLGPLLRRPVLRVVDAAGKPVERPSFHAAIAAGDADAQPEEAWTILAHEDLGDGRWGLLLPRARRVDVLVYDRGQGWQLVEDPHGEVTVELGGLQEVELRVAAPDGLAVAWPRLHLQVQDAATRLPVAVERLGAADGQVAFRLRPPGTGALTLRWYLRREGRTSTATSELHVPANAFGGRLEVEPPAEWVARLRGGD